MRFSDVPTVRLHRSLLVLGGALLASCGDSGTPPPTPPPTTPAPVVSVRMTFASSFIDLTTAAAGGTVSLRPGRQSRPFGLEFRDSTGVQVVPGQDDRIEFGVSDEAAVAVPAVANGSWVVSSLAPGDASVEVALIRRVAGQDSTLFRSAPLPVSSVTLPAAAGLSTPDEDVRTTRTGADGAIVLDVEAMEALEVDLLDDQGGPAALLAGEELTVTLRGSAPAAELTESGESRLLRGLIEGTDTLDVVLRSGQDELVRFAPVEVHVVTPVCSGPTNGGLCLRLVHAGLDFPTNLVSPPGDDRMFVTRQVGVIDILHPDRRVTRFLDMQDKVFFGNEKGLLGLAFHPDYASNRTFFVYYKLKDGDMALDRMVVSGDPDVADASSAERILTVDHDAGPNTDPSTQYLHNAGHILFGPDGYLWVTVGDGGVNPDLDVSQNLADLRGSILRIDVPPSPEPAGYEIPPDNPFVGGFASTRKEIYVYGLRNPWRIDIDPVERMLYIADVGERTYEELNVVPLSPGGQNFGWDFLEGDNCRIGDCSGVDHVLPTLFYGRDEGQAIIGGFVARNAGVPALEGRYLYADHTGILRSVAVTGGQAGAVQEHFGLGELFQDSANPGYVTSFGRDDQGRIYLLMFGGRIYRIEPAPEGT